MDIESRDLFSYASGLRISSNFTLKHQQIEVDLKWANVCEPDELWKLHNLNECESF